MNLIDDIVYAWDFIRENEVLDVPMVDELFKIAVETGAAFEMYHVMKAIDEGVRALEEGRTFRKVMGVYCHGVNGANWLRVVLADGRFHLDGLLIYEATRKDGYLRQSLYRASAHEALEYIRQHFDEEGNQKQ